MADTTSNPNELAKTEGDQSSEEKTDEIKTGGEQSEGTDKEQTEPKSEESSSEDSKDEKGEGESKESNDQDQTKDEGKKEEGTFFDPKKVPPELMPVFKQMQAGFTQKMQGLADLRTELEGIRDKFKPGTAPTEDQQKKAEAVAESVVSEVLKARGINSETLNPDQKAFLDLVEDIATRASLKTVQPAIKPLYEKEVKKEVDTYFEKTPKATPYRRAMAELDRKTGGTLSLDQLYDLASRKDRDIETRTKESSRAESKRLNNTESSGSSATGAPEDSNPFKKLVSSAKDSKLPF